MSGTVILVIDLKQVNLWQLTSRRWAKFDETHQRPINRSLAELLARVYVINAPSWAVTFYKSIRWWVPKNTRSKVRLLGTEFQAELLRVMSREVMTSMLEAFAPDGTLQQTKDGPPPAMREPLSVEGGIVTDIGVTPPTDPPSTASPLQAVQPVAVDMGAARERGARPPTDSVDEISVAREARLHQESEEKRNQVYAMSGKKKAEVDAEVADEAKRADKGGMNKWARLLGGFSLLAALGAIAFAMLIDEKK